LRSYGIKEGEDVAKVTGKAGETGKVVKEISELD